MVVPSSPGDGAYRRGQRADLLRFMTAARHPLGFGWLATRALERVPLPSDGLYPVATMAVGGLAYGLAEVAHGSGFLAVYLVDDVGMSKRVFRRICKVILCPSNNPRHCGAPAGFYLWKGQIRHTRIDEVLVRRAPQ